MATGLLLLIGFALPPVLQLAQCAAQPRDPARTGRPASRWRWPPMAWAWSCSSRLLLWQAGNLKLALLTAAGFLGGFAVFALVGWLAAESVCRLLRGAVSSCKLALCRHRAAAAPRRNRGAGSRAGARADGVAAADRDARRPGCALARSRRRRMRRTASSSTFSRPAGRRSRRGWRASASPLRLVSDDPRPSGRRERQAVTADNYADDARAPGRPRIQPSTMRDPPPQNKIVAGRWYDDGRARRGLGRGRHRQDLGPEAGRHAALRHRRPDRWRRRSPACASSTGDRCGSISSSSSIRQRWPTCRKPRSPPFTCRTARNAFGNQLARDFPNLTVVDIGSMLQQVQSVLDQVVTRGRIPVSCSRWPPACWCCMRR